jgi:hypothetical protein
MTRLGAHGFDIDLPRGWEGRIVRRAATNPAEQTRAVVHAASFPLPEERGDFGVGVTELMRPGDAFVTLFEYGPESVGRPLFAATGMPRLTASMFSSRRLQRSLAGQLGCQTFFTAERRPFCLYVVVAGRLHLAGAITKVNAMLHTLELSR